MGPGYVGAAWIDKLNRLTCDHAIKILNNLFVLLSIL